MFVRDRMSAPVKTVTPDTPFQEALRLMREGRFRRLPVVDHDQRLVGIVSERDLLHAAPSPATSLSVWEMNYLLSKLKIEQLMAKDVVSVTADTPVEEAAGMMVTNRIGGMPVVDGDRHVVGIITETDIFKAFVEMMGINQPGLRLVLCVPGAKGTLGKLTTAIAEQGGNIISVGTYNVDLAGTASVIVKVVGVRQEQLVDTLEALGDHVVDVRQI
jgi:acetoin utilization protein AcuB